jgi:hypothetical protein
VENSRFALGDSDVWHFPVIRSASGLRRDATAAEFIPDFRRRPTAHSLNAMKAPLARRPIAGMAPFFLFLVTHVMHANIVANEAGLGVAASWRPWLRWLDSP